MVQSVLCGNQPTYSDGVAVIDRVRPNGSDVDTQYQQQWSKGWTTIMPYEWAGFVQYLAYKAGYGDVAIDRIGVGGTTSTTCSPEVVPGLD